MARHATAALAAGALALTAVALTVPSASADTQPPTGTPVTAAADVLPSLQTDGVVWSMVTVGTTVYATGNFTKTWPAGETSTSPNSTPRGNLLAFDITTGKLIPGFDHTLNAQGRRIVVSPDKTQVFVTGDFTTVDGQARAKIAAFSVATGALDPTFAPRGAVSTFRSLAVSNDTVYAGGAYSRSGVVRNYISAYDRATGALKDWAPTVDNIVDAMVLTEDQSRLIIGGRFQNVNGVKKVGITALDPKTGASLPWSSEPIADTVTFIPGQGGDGQWQDWVTDLAIQDGVVYGSANGQGEHMFDGRFAARASSGDLVWLDNCYGATYGVYPRGDVLYAVSHSHDCTSLGAFGEASPARYQKAIAETTYPTGTDKGMPGRNSHYAFQPVPSLLHWFPDLANGTFTGQAQAAWTITGTGNYVAIGGEFPKINGAAQSGIARFGLGNTSPKKLGAVKNATLIPSTFGFPGRNVRVGWKATWDKDNETLTYEVLRGTTVVKTVTQKSNFWTTPDLSYTDTVPATGSYTYRIRVTDPDGNVVTGDASQPINVWF